MRVVGFICVAFGLSTSLYVLWHVTQFWRGRSVRLEAVLRSTDSQSPAARAYVRAFPVIAFFMIPVLMVVLFLGFVDLGKTVSGAIVSLLFVLCLLFLILLPSVVLFNRPTFLVAPSLRDEPGLLTGFARRR